MAAIGCAQWVSRFWLIIGPLLCPHITVYFVYNKSTLSCSCIYQGCITLRYNLVDPQCVGCGPTLHCVGTSGLIARHVRARWPAVGTSPPPGTGRKDNLGGWLVTGGIGRLAHTSLYLGHTGLDQAGSRHCATGCCIYACF